MDDAGDDEDEEVEDFSGVAGFPAFLFEVGGDGDGE